MPSRRASLAATQQQQQLPALDLDDPPVTPTPDASRRASSRQNRGRPRVEPRDETAADRRRTQIRLAQRAYRQRKEATIVSLRMRNSELHDMVERMASSFLAFSDAAIVAPSVTADTVLARSLRATTEEFLKLARRAAELGEDDDGAPGSAQTKSRNDAALKVEQNLQIPPSPSPLQQQRALPTPPPRQQQRQQQPQLPQQQSQQSQQQQQHRQTFRSESDRFGGYSVPTSRVNAPTAAAAINNNIFGSLFPADPAYSAQMAFGAPYSLSPYSFQETSLARRLHRAALESGLHLLTDSDTRDARFQRTFTIALRLASQPVILEHFRSALTRSVHDPLRIEGLPHVVLGGAGQHVGQPSTSLVTKRRALQPAVRSALGVPIAAAAGGSAYLRELAALPPSPTDDLAVADPNSSALLVRPVNAAAARLVPAGIRGPTSSLQPFASTTFSLAPYRGVWFLPEELDSFLSTRGLVLDPTAVFADVSVVAVEAVLRDAAADDAGVDDFSDTSDPESITEGEDPQPRGADPTRFSHFDAPIFADATALENQFGWPTTAGAAALTRTANNDAILSSPDVDGDEDMGDLDVDLDSDVIHSSRTEPLMDPPTPPALVAASAVTPMAGFVSETSPLDLTLDLFDGHDFIKTEAQAAAAGFGALSGFSVAPPPTAAANNSNTQLVAQDASTSLARFSLASPPETPANTQARGGAESQSQSVMPGEEPIIVNVERFVALLARRFVWLGREPGWRKRDVGRALRRSMISV